MNKLTGKPTVTPSSLINDCVAAYEKQKIQKEKNSELDDKVNRLVRAIINNFDKFKMDHFRDIDSELKVIVFNKLLSQHPLPPTVIDLIDPGVRKNLLSQKENQETKKALLDMAVQQIVEDGKIILDAKGLSQLDIEKAFGKIARKENIAHLVITNSLYLDNLNFLKDFLLLKKLECLHCTSLKDIKGIQHCQDLETVDLSHSIFLETLEGLENCHKLKKAIFNDCSLKDWGIIPLWNLTNLVYLDLSNNSTTIRSYLNIPWENLNLEHLDFSRNAYLPTEADLNKLTKLKTINLPYNRYNPINYKFVRKVEVNYIGS